MTDTESRTIFSQILAPVKMSLGAHNFRFGAKGDLAFDARILPFTKAGKRAGQPRIMTVLVKLNSLDLYDIEVVYYRTSSRYGSAERVTHYEATIDVSDLNRTLLALDYDGDHVLNPRMV